MAICSSIFSADLAADNIALSSDHANCSSFLVMLPLVIILSFLLFILCIALAVMLYMLIHYRKKMFLHTSDKGGHHLRTSQHVKFCDDVSSNHNRVTYENRMGVDIYEPPACINGSSILYESVYLQTYFDESSVDDSRKSVVTSHSYPITSSEQWTILDDQPCQTIHENLHAIQLDQKEAELQIQHSLEFGDSSVHRVWSCDRKHL